MYTLECVCYLWMLTALWLRRGPFLWFAIVQSLWLIETILLTIWVHDPFWFSSNVFDIWASGIIGLLVWKRMPAVTLLMLFWSLVSILQYNHVDIWTREEFWRSGAGFYLAKVTDLFINGVVIWYTMRPNGFSSSKTRCC